VNEKQPGRRGTKRKDLVFFFFFFFFVFRGKSVKCVPFLSFPFISFHFVKSVKSGEIPLKMGEIPLKFISISISMKLKSRNREIDEIVRKTSFLGLPTPFSFDAFLHNNDYYT
jgi:hypothetical protein